jgi:DMSO/TMAO reductase YedYZ molybdopterin-dependent catalytic subunit
LTKSIKKRFEENTIMATITQAAKKVAFNLTRPLVKIIEGGKQVPLSPDEAKRIPPGQFATDRFNVLHHETRMPTAKDIEHWTLTIDGEVEKPLVLTLAQLKQLPNTTITADFHCVTSWSRLDNKWTGVKVKDVLILAKPKGGFVTQTAFSGHTTSTPLADLLTNEALIVWEQEGKPLTEEHGAPLRIILPKKYAYKGVKWLTKLTVTSKEELGFWEVRGYSQTADPWKNDRYS